MITLAWIATGLCLALAALFGAKAYLVKRMLESYELGLKMGRVGAIMGQSWFDEQLRACGIDPDKLPKR